MKSDQLARLRDAYGLSLDDVATLMGVSKSTVFAWQKNKREVKHVYSLIMKTMLKLRNDEFKRDRAKDIVDTALNFCHQWGEDPLQFLLINMYTLFSQEVNYPWAKDPGACGKPQAPR